MINTFSLTRVGVVLAFLAIAAGPANAEAEQYEKPALMHAILAKVWGNVCPGTLSKSEIAEVQKFIDRWVSTRSDPEMYINADGNGGAQDLEKTYTQSYRTPGACLEVQTKRQAQAYLLRIRKATSDPDYWAWLRR